MENSVTVVLPARNCRQQLFRCLRALAAGTIVPKIIVVDDGSSDGTGAMVRRHWPSAVLLSLPAHTGYAHAANAGLRLVRTDYAFLLRPDLLPGKKCTAHLLEAMRNDACTPRAGEAGLDVFCAVPRIVSAREKTFSEGSAREKIFSEGSAREKAFSEGSAREKAFSEGSAREKAFSEGKSRAPRRKKNVRQILAAPDGCAMYRMKVLEEIGWLDERHFDGLEAFDLSLRGTLCGYRTVEVPGAAVRPSFPQKDPFSTKELFSGEEPYSREYCAFRMEHSFRDDPFRRQLAAGNSRYVFYKNLPLAQRIPLVSVPGAAQALQALAAARRGELGKYRTGVSRGRVLCSLEKERRAARKEGAGIWPENLSDAAFLGMEEEARRIYPLYLAEKMPVSPARLPAYLRIQLLLLREMPRLAGPGILK